MFFVDKYAPKTKYELLFHKEIWKLVDAICKNKSIPHIILCGPPESGKKTIINFLLESIFDATVRNLVGSVYTVSGSGSNQNKEVIIPQSNHHIVIEPSGNNSDFYLIQCVVKQFAQIAPLNVFESKRPFKVVLVNRIDNLSTSAQSSLRRTIENFSKTCRFIMWCRSLSRVDETLRSRCYCIKIPAPSNKELIGLIARISHKENIPLAIEDYHEILANANGRIKVLMWMLQLKKLESDYGTTHEDNIKEIVKILLKPKIEKLKEVRRLLYNNIITNIKGSQLLKNIVVELIKHVENEEIKCEIISEAAKLEHRLNLGRREITHLESFINAIYYMLHSKTNKTAKTKSKKIIESS